MSQALLSVVVPISTSFCNHPGLHNVVDLILCLRKLKVREKQFAGGQRLVKEEPRFKSRWLVLIHSSVFHCIHTSRFCLHD